MTDRLRLLPLLAFYVAVVLIGAREGFVGDEARYAKHAVNLSRGYFATPAELDLWSGPGYPLVLALCVKLRLPWLGWKLLNPLFLLAAVWYLHAALALYVPRRAALGFAWLFGLYPPLWRQAELVMTEPFALLLVCALTYHMCRACAADGAARRHILLGGACAGWLALTKILFGYVLAAGLLLAVLLGATRRWRPFRRAAAVYGVGLLLCAPYLVYTHGLTGNWFYWGTSGGMQLYWMSTPYAHEYGEWHPEHFHGVATIQRNHGPFFASIAGLDPVARDAAFKRQALRHIRAHPRKYVHNWIANVGRILFEYPFAYLRQHPSTYAVMLPNMLVYTVALCCIYPAWRARRRLPPGLAILLLFWAIAFGGASLVSAFERHGRIILPPLALWMAYTMTRTLRIEFREEPS